MWTRILSRSAGHPSALYARISHFVSLLGGPQLSAQSSTSRMPRSDSVRRDVCRRDRADPAGRSTTRPESPRCRVLRGPTPPPPLALYLVPQVLSPRSSATMSTGERTEKGERGKKGVAAMVLCPRRRSVYSTSPRVIARRYGVHHRHRYGQCRPHHQWIDRWIGSIRPRRG
jgi:hypothetical protein